MKLILVRHGKAEDTADASGERPLSARGESDIAAQAAFLKNAGVTVAQVFHSGKLRAQQTAEIIAAQIAPSAPIEGMDYITPMDDPVHLVQSAESWANAGADTLVAGHNPFMERLAARLMGNSDEESAMVTVKTGTIMCFEHSSPGHWHMRWMVVPKLTRNSAP